MHHKGSSNLSQENYGLNSQRRPLSLIKSLEFLTSPKPSKLKFTENNPLKSIQIAVFDLYGVGLNYSPSSGYGLPYGSGFLITTSLILTTNKNIPTPEHAQIAILKFSILSQSTVYRLSPNSFFFTSISKNFTIVALAASPKLSLVPKFSPKSKFKVFKSANLKILTPSLLSGLVTSVSQAEFTFVSSGLLLPGVPILNENWKLQGMYLRTDNRGKLALRVDSVLQILLQSNPPNLHKELEELIGKYSSLPSLPILKTRLGDTKDLFWVKSGHWSIYHFDFASKIWNMLQIMNISSLRTTPAFKFKANSRIINLPDNSFLIIGGNDPESNQPIGEIFQVFPSSGVIQKRMSMQEGRASFSLVYRLGHIYAIGGSLREITCERYSVQSDRWEPIADLNESRKNASATLFLQDCFIFVFGGEGRSGRSIERYSFQFDKWEVLTVILPCECVNPGIFVFDINKIAILGGKNSESVLVIEQDTYVKETNNQVREEIFRVFQVDVLPHKLVCCSSPLLVWNRGLLYFVNERQNGVPDVFEYPVKKLSIFGADPLGEFKNTSQSGSKVQVSNRLMTPDYFDTYF